MALVSELELPTFDHTDPSLRGERFHAVMGELRSHGWLAQGPFGYVTLDREAGEFFLRTRSAIFPGMKIAEIFGVASPLVSWLAIVAVALAAILKLGYWHFIDRSSSARGIGVVARASRRSSRSRVTSPASEWRRQARRISSSSAPLTSRSTDENAAPPTFRVRSSPVGKIDPVK